MQTRRGGRLYRITAPNFVALYQLTDDHHQIWWAAPIIRHMERWSDQKAKDYCWTKEWKLDRQDSGSWIEEVRPPEP